MTGERTHDNNGFEDEFKKKVTNAMEGYSRDSERVPNHSEIPDRAILTKDGLIEIQQDSTKIPGGEFNVDIVVDVSYCIYGRLASKIASEALEGWSIAVVNVEDTIITGNPENTIEKFQTRRDIGSDQGPIYPKQPHRLFKRSVRGMLPYKTQRGGEALQRIRAYKQNPYEIDGLKLDGTKAKSPIKNHTYLKEVSKKLG